MANLILVQWVIASHVKVWTCQFWWEFYQELTVTMVQVPEGMAVSTQGQHISNRKTVMLNKDSPLSSHLTDYVCKLDNFFFDLVSLKSLIACSLLWGCERQIFN